MTILHYYSSRIISAFKEHCGKIQARAATLWGTQNGVRTKNMWVSAFLERSPKIDECRNCNVLKERTCGSQIREEVCKLVGEEEVMEAAKEKRSLVSVAV